MVIHFTRKSLLDCKPPLKGRIYLHDARQKGLSAYITDQGLITFFVRKRVNGKDQRIHLGHFPDLSVDGARRKVLEVRTGLAQGIDPQQGKNNLRQQMTFGQMFENYMERHSKPFTKGWQSDERMVPRLLSHFFDRPACQISRTEFLELHEKIGHENGFYQANHLLEKARAIYNKAIEWGWEGRNPTKGLKMFKKKSRERFIRKDEMPRFFRALAEEGNHTARDYFLLSLLTGARQDNVLAMRWQEIDFHSSEWHIPETKNGEPHVVPLTPSVLKILQERRRDATSVYVFPGRGKTGYLSRPKQVWKRVLERADISGLRMHDLRRTLGSWMAGMGATTAIIGKTLAHKDLRSTKVYERLDREPVREFVGRANGAILQVAYSPPAPHREAQGTKQAATTPSAYPGKTMESLLRHAANIKPSLERNG